ncbi:Cation/acetate symporter ActP [compost metagenome]
MTGLLSALGLVILSPTVWVTVLGHEHAIFPYDHPALFAMPLTFLVIVLVSKLDRSARAALDHEGFDDQMVRAQTGVGIAGASEH